MPRSTPARALRPLVLAPLAALAAACSDPTGTDAPARHVPDAPALSVAQSTPTASSAPVSTVTPLPDGGFRFTSTAILDVPQGAAWAKLHNIEKTVEIALAGIASDFRWVDGGSPGKAPSRFEFSALGTLVQEEVYRLDHAEKVLGYRLVVPALGIQRYVATISLDPVDATHARVVFSRDIVFDDPASVDAFAALFEQEIAAIQAYFDDRGR